MTISKWASSSLLGHVVLFETILSLPLSIVFLELNFSQGTLTAAWAFDMALIWAALGAVVAVLGWYTVSAPLIRLRRNRFAPGTGPIGTAKQ